MRRMGSAGKTYTPENHFLKMTKVHSPKNIVLYARSSLLPWTTNERFLIRMILKSKGIFRDLAAQSPQIHRKLQQLTANKSLSWMVGIIMLWCLFFLGGKNIDNTDCFVICQGVACFFLLLQKHFFLFLVHWLHQIQVSIVLTLLKEDWWLYVNKKSSCH